MKSPLKIGRLNIILHNSMVNKDIEFDSFELQKVHNKYGYLGEKYCIGKV